MRWLLKGRQQRDPAAERVLFAVGANRALASSSKLTTARLACEDVQVCGLAATIGDACHRAMNKAPGGHRGGYNGDSSRPCVRA